MVSIQSQANLKEKGAQKSCLLFQETTLRVLDHTIMMQMKD